MKTDKQTFLFFPIEVGLAHVTRSLAIGEELKRRGHHVFFALPKEKQKLFQQSSVSFVDVMTTLTGESILFLDDFKKSEFVYSRMKDELRVIDEIKPHKIIVDFRISALGAAAARNIKTYTIFEGSALPYGGFIPNPGFPKIMFSPMSKIALLLFNRLKNSFLKPLLEVSRKFGNTMDLDAWYKSVTYILPESSFYLPSKNKKITAYYVGPWGWSGFRKYSPSWLSKIKPDGKTIYLTFGGTGFDSVKLVQIANLLIKNNYRVVISTGTICEPSVFPKHPNLFVAKFLNGEEVSQLVDLVVCHAGYGTLMQAVCAEKPAVSIPFNPDQVIHGWRSQELGMGQCILRLGIDNVIDLLSMDFGTIENIGKKLDPKKVLSAVKHIFARYPEYVQAIRRFNALGPTQDGAVGAADVIEK
ncbi:MAG: glycosyltransferase [Patescibacteria group bacterium]|jgi:UDP:flavonoid glycosyltransferase YjiC (YdhE family)